METTPLLSPAIVARALDDAPFAVVLYEGPEFLVVYSNHHHDAFVDGRLKVGDKLLDKLPELKSQPVIAAMRRVLETGATQYASEVPSKLRRDGVLEDRWYDVTWQAMRNADAVVGVMVSAVDVTTHVQARSASERAEAALRESEAQLREVVDHLPELAWSARADGHIDFYNRRWYEYTGTTFEQMQGWGWEKVHHPDSLAKVVAAWTHSLQTGEPMELEFPLRGADGSFRWFLTRVRPLRDGEGNIVRWIGINTDVTAMREAEARSREAVRLRDDFLTVASHELRTPLTAVQLQLDGLARRLSHAADPDVVRKKIETVRRQTSRLARLVDDLLDVSRITLGKLTLNLEHVDLGEVVCELAEHYAAHARSAGSSLTVDSSAGVVGQWDRVRLEQVVGNLIANAIKYGEGKPIAVHVFRSGEAAVVSVHDQGLGIAASDIRRIFERFEQAVPMRNYGGLGLGLYIARQIVEAHGGTLSVEAKPGEGATFTVKLPLKASSSIQPAT